MLIEPVPIAEVFAMGIEPPEDCGTHFRVVVFDERSALVGTELERIVVGRFVFPRPAFYAAVKVAAMKTVQNRIWALTR